LGWHVASNSEYTTSVTYLTNSGYGYGGSGDDIAKALAATFGWGQTSDNPGIPDYDKASNNSSGFTALPSGKREATAIFNDYGCQGKWWTSSEAGTSLANCPQMMCYWAYLYRGSLNKKCGLSIRRIKD
jgi:uncharacterized protein (TIGR02145 family)